MRKNVSVVPYRIELDCGKPNRKSAKSKPLFGKRLALRVQSTRHKARECISPASVLIGIGVDLYSPKFTTGLECVLTFHEADTVCD